MISLTVFMTSEMWNCHRSFSMNRAPSVMFLRFLSLIPFICFHCWILYWITSSGFRIRCECLARWYHVSLSLHTLHIPKPRRFINLTYSSGISEIFGNNFGIFFVLIDIFFLNLSSIFAFALPALFIMYESTSPISCIKIFELVDSRTRRNLLRDFPIWQRIPSLFALLISSRIGKI